MEETTALTPVLLIADDSVLAFGLAHILERTGEFQLIDTVSDTPAALPAVSLLQPAIIMIDVNLTMSLSFVAEIRKRSPNAHICLWARNLPDELAYEAMKIGVRGILGRTLPVTALVECLRRLSADQVWFEERLMSGFFSYRTVRLTRRESQLMDLLAQGMKNKEIACALSLSQGTVKVYLSRLFAKLGVKDRFELALYGLRHLMADPARHRAAAGDGDSGTISSLPIGPAAIAGTMHVS